MKVEVQTKIWRDKDEVDKMLYTMVILYGLLAGVNAVVFLWKRGWFLMSLNFAFWLLMIFMILSRTKYRKEVKNEVKDYEQVRQEQRDTDTFKEEVRLI